MGKSFVVFAMSLLLCAFWAHSQEKSVVDFAYERMRSNQSKYYYNSVTKGYLEAKKIVRPLAGVYAFVLFKGAGLSKALLKGGLVGAKKELGKEAILASAKLIVEHPSRAAKQIAYEDWDMGMRAYRENYEIYQKVVKGKEALGERDAGKFVLNEILVEYMPLGHNLIKEVISYENKVGKYKEGTNQKMQNEVLQEIEEVSNKSNYLEKLDFAQRLLKILASRNMALSDYPPYAKYMKNREKLDELYLSRWRLYSLTQTGEKTDSLGSWSGSYISRGGYGDGRYIPRRRKEWKTSVSVFFENTYPFFGEIDGNPSKFYNLKVSGNKISFCSYIKNDPSINRYDFVGMMKGNRIVGTVRFSTHARGHRYRFQGSFSLEKQRESKGISFDVVYRKSGYDLVACIQKGHARIKFIYPSGNSFSQRVRNGERIPLRPGNFQTILVPPGILWKEVLGNRRYGAQGRVVLPKSIVEWEKRGKLQVSGIVVKDRSKHGIYWKILRDEKPSHMTIQTQDGVGKNLAISIVEHKKIMGLNRAEFNALRDRRGLSWKGFYRNDVFGRFDNKIRAASLKATLQFLKGYQPAKFGSKQERYFGGKNTDEAVETVEVSDGYVIAANTESFGNGRQDAWIVKMNRQGKKVWEYTYGSTGHDAISSITKTKENGFLLAGYTFRRKKGKDGWLLRLNAKGRKVWEKKIDRGGKGDTLHRAILTRDGNYIAVGSTGIGYGKPTYSSNVWVILFSPDGRILWEKSFGGARGDSGYDIVERKDGSFLVVADSYSYEKNSTRKQWIPTRDAWLIFLDKNGQKIGERIFGTPNNEFPKKILKSKDGGYLLVGTSQIGWVAKLDSKGKLLWQSFLGDGGSTVRGEDVREIPCGFYLVATSASNRGVCLLDQKGHVVWSREFRGSPKTLILLGNRKFLLIGYGVRSGSRNRDVWMRMGTWPKRVYVDGKFVILGKSK